MFQQSLSPSLHHRRPGFTIRVNNHTNKIKKLLSRSVMGDSHTGSQTHSGCVALSSPHLTPNTQTHHGRLFHFYPYVDEVRSNSKLSVTKWIPTNIDSRRLFKPALLETLVL